MAIRFQKRAFTQEELSLAIVSGHIRIVDKHYRKRVKGYPIDDIDPTRASDRDDAIFAEVTAEGYRIYVTIADVATHIAKHSPLDLAAQKRGFTLYRPPARDPMLPFVLSEDRLSLEHEKERLGVTVIIDLDRKFACTGVSFLRSLITPECLDYATASRRMAEDEDDLSLLHHIARGVRDGVAVEFPPSPTQIFDKAGLLRQVDEGGRKASKLVQVMMIFANNAIAMFFAQTGLPFLYRVHEYAGREAAKRAEYQPFDLGHYSLQSEGLVGAYSHCTSPIRRYADLINQRMMHYVMDVEDALAELCESLMPDAAPVPAEVIWQHLPRLLNAYQGRQADKLLAAAAGFLSAVAGGVALQDEWVYRVEAVLDNIPIPYTFDELTAITGRINGLQAEEVKEVAEINRRNLARWNEKVEEDLAAGHYETLSAPAFSGMLRRAAVTGRINEAFALEVAARLYDDRIELVPDIYAIVVLCKDYHHKFWRGLKRQALNRIERDPLAVNNIFEKAMKEGEIHRDTYIAETKLWDLMSKKPAPITPSQPEPEVDAALVVTFMEALGNREYAASNYSLGYSRKDAMRHARFNFLRALTFGELGPLDQTILPTPLYAELTLEQRSRSAVLQEMVAELGLHIRELGPRARLDGNVSFAYQVYGPGIEHAVLGFAVADKEEQVREDAATRILRSMQFKRVYSQQHPVPLGFPTNPIYYLRQWAADKGYAIHTPERHHIEEIARNVFRAEVKLVMGGGAEVSAAAEGRNKDNALLYAYTLLKEKLQEQGHLPQETDQPEQVHWVTWSALPRDVAQEGDEG